MRIAIDAGVIGTGRGGDETYMRNLLAGLAMASGDAHEFLVYLRPTAVAPVEIRSDRRFTVRRLAVLPSPLRYGLGLPLALMRERPSADLVLTTNHAPIVSPVPRVLLVHDLSFRHHPEHYTATTRRRLNWLVPIHARQARLVVTVSEFSREDIVRELGVPADRVAVVPNSVREIVRTPRGPVSGLRARGIGDRFFLYVGNLQPRKNLARLIGAFARARTRSSAVAGHQLVIAGAPAWRADDVMQAAAALPGLVILLGRIDDAERDELLDRATALAYVSLFEGFGLPPLEAMARGTPVLASATTAIPEVVGDAALLVDPTDVDAIAGGLARLAEDPLLRERLRERGRARASAYSVRRMGEAALAAFATARAAGDRRSMTTAYALDVAMKDEGEVG